MKVSEVWLREWVNPALTSQELVTQLTMAGLEVDAINPVAGMFNHIIVAHVLQTTPHPQADRLTLCQVETGGESPLQIVCGASNVRPGLKVALALPGAVLPNGMTIKESKLRGELSQGMLCSVSELGMEDRSEGILELPDDAPVGVDLRNYMILDDNVLDVDLTPNRADCFSMLGVAREVAALNTLPLQSIPAPKIAPTHDHQLTVHLTTPEACPRYVGRIIQRINSDAVTPLWMKERLRRAGIRAVHPVVDVTNYVMIELGQPMHAYDLSALQGEIHVRCGRANETLKLLDGQTITLQEQVHIIADSQKPLAIAGIMGGEEGSVQASTQDIFLESAFFNPVMIAGVARRYGLCSDSSQRFERGVDPQLQIQALERATELLLAIVGGEPGPTVVTEQKIGLPDPIVVSFNPEKVKQLTGLVIAHDTMETMLQGLGMRVVRQDSSWTVDVPSHRFDIKIDVDLVEEIVRLYGYGNIVAQPMETTMQAGSIHATESLAMSVSAFLSHRGYNETISYSFVDPQFQQALYPDKNSMQLLNPISSELSQMRVGLWPGLLASMIHNVHRQQTVIRLFETGVVFDMDGQNLSERPCIAGLLTGEYGASNWSESTGQFDFFDMKGDLEALFSGLQIASVRFARASHPALHPGQSAKILVNGIEAGWIGVLHPSLADELDLKTEVMLFELSLMSLINNNPVRYRMISKYPNIRRDLSLLVDESVTAGQIEEAVREVVQPELLKGFDVFDVYIGETIPQGKKSLAIALTLQDEKRTLVDAEVNAVIDLILKKLDVVFSITLRDIASGN